MIINPIKEAAPLAIHRLKDLLSKYDEYLNKPSDDPHEATRLCKSVMEEFIRDFCALFGKTVSVENADRDYMNLSVSPQRLDAPLADWLSRVKIMVPAEGQSINPTDQVCKVHFGEVRTIMNQVKLTIDEMYSPK